MKRATILISPLILAVKNPSLFNPYSRQNNHLPCTKDASGGHSRGHKSAQHTMRGGHKQLRNKHLQASEELDRQCSGACPENERSTA
jgi:hypothetical protein